MENSSTSTLSPLSPQRWPADAFKIPQTIATAVAIFILMIASLFLLIAGAQLAGAGLQVHRVSGAHIDPAQTTRLFLLQDVSYIPVVGFIFYILPKLAKRNLAELGLKAPTWNDVRLGLIGVVCTWLAVAAVSIAFDTFTHQTHSQKELELFQNLNGMQTVVSIVTAVFLAPFFEEVVFRLFLLNALLRYLPASVAIVLDGALFGLAHGQLDIVPSLAMCGIGLAAVYYRSGSLWANIIAHACFNGITTVAVLFLHYKG